MSFAALRRARVKAIQNSSTIAKTESVLRNHFHFLRDLYKTYALSGEHGRGITLDSVLRLYAGWGFTKKKSLIVSRNGFRDFKNGI